MATTRRAFTLIELLVVIAIIALLIGLLLPALGKARKAARQAISLSNISQIAKAGSVYQADQKGMLPITMVWGIGNGHFTSPTNPSDPAVDLAGWCTWSAWGKNCHYLWQGRGFDPYAANRPLNAYISAVPLEVPASATPTDQARLNSALPICRDPSDNFQGHQQNWPNGNTNPFISCYDDVGTSYQWQAKWWDQINIQMPGLAFNRRFDVGTRRFKIADGFQPSRMVWLNDEWADIIMNSPSDNFRVRNGYDDINRSVLGYMDGHAAYHAVIPGGASHPEAATRPDRVPAFNNEKYCVIFPFLR